MDRVFVQFQVDRKLRAELKKFARANDMSLSKLMERLAIAFADRNGIKVEREEPVIQEPDRR